jgi:hypothetical protein
MFTIGKLPSFGSAAYLSSQPSRGVGSRRRSVESRAFSELKANVSRCLLQPVSVMVILVERRHADHDVSQDDFW